MKGAIGQLLKPANPGGKGLGGEDSATDRDPAGQPEDSQADTQQDAQGEAAGQERQASPEMQDAYDRAVLAGVDVIFDKQTNPGIVKMLQSGADDPPTAVAHAVAMVIQILEEKSKNQLPGEIIIDLADELAGNLIALAGKLKLFAVDESLKGKVAQQVTALIAQLYPASPEDVQGLMAGMSQDQLAKINEEQSQYAGTTAAQQPAPTGGTA